MTDLTAARTELSAPGARFVRADEPADLCVVLVNYNTAHLLERCIGDLRAASRDLAVRVVIVDNASRDDSVAFIRQHFLDCILVANPVNVGFGRANNQALEYGNAPFVLLLNTDAFVFPDTLVKSVQYMRLNPGCGVLGVRLINEAHEGSYTGRPFPHMWENFLLQVGLTRHHVPPPLPLDARPPTGETWHCDWVVGCYYMIRQEVIQQVGLFDPRYFLYFEEVDHCRAVKQAGWTVECLSTTSAIHIGGGSAESEGELTSGARQISALQIESELLYFRKHNGMPGLLLNVALTLLSDLVRALKWIIKKRRFTGAGMFWSNASLVCRLALDTRLGTRATR